MSAEECFYCWRRIQEVMCGRCFVLVATRKLRRDMHKLHGCSNAMVHWYQIYKYVNATKTQNDLGIVLVADVPFVPLPSCEDVEGEDQLHAGSITPPASVQEDHGEERDGAESDDTALKTLIPLSLDKKMDTDPAPPPAADDGVLQRRRWSTDKLILASETRIQNRIDQLVTSFNGVVQEGVDEVPAKSSVAFADFAEKL